MRRDYYLTPFPALTDALWADGISLDVVTPLSALIRNEMPIVAPIGTGDVLGFGATPPAMEGDDYGQDVDSAGSLPFAEAVAGVIGTQDDRDWFRFVLDEPSTFQFQLEGPEGIELALFDNTGAQIDIDVAANAPLEFSAGTYFLDVSTMSGLPNGPENYTIRLEAVADDLPEAAADAPLLSLDAPIKVINNYDDDQDSFKFTISEAGEYQIFLSGRNSDSTFAQIKQIIDGVETLVRANFFNGTLIFSADAAGEFILSIDHPFVVPEREESSINVAIDTIVDDYGDDIANAAQFSEGGVTRGALDYLDDRDVFEFSLDAGEAVTFALNRLVNPLGFRLEVLDSDGDLVQELFTLRLGQTFTNDGDAGTFYLRVGSFEDRTLTGGYQLIKIDAGDDIGDTTETARALSFTDSTYGSFAPLPDGENDTDAFTFELGAGQDVRITLNEVNDSRNLFNATYLLVDENGRRISLDIDDSFARDVLSFTSRDSGTYTLFVTSQFVTSPYAYSLDLRTFTTADATSGPVIGGYGKDVLSATADGAVLVGDVAVGLEGLEGELFRAYQAVFGREPDKAGFNLFLTELRIGNLTQADIVSEFVSSAEFQQTYGDLTNRDFVEQLYSNVLPGNMDQAGRDAFTAALDNGSLTRTDMVLEFTNSGEFIANMVLPSAAFGRNVILNPVEFSVFRAYEAVFGRLPDAEGFISFVNAIEAGVIEVEGMTAEFVASAEFQATYGALSNGEFVELLYQNVLPGNMDAAGRAAFTSALDAGALSRADMVAEFVASAEFIARTEKEAKAFIEGVFGNSSDSLSTQGFDGTLYGGRGRDDFFYEGGDVEILDFTVRVDTIAVSNNLPDIGFFGLFEFMDLARQVGADIVLDFGEDIGTLILRNVDLDDFTAYDIL